ncbi:hypothetical protein OPQ81_009135 [Rhizoctonia solani]|nr:hypothetical protein OPQ81_009135 [Rhizoctonia solani]
MASLHPGVLDDSDGIYALRKRFAGALSETTYDANLNVWKKIKLKTRAIRNVANISTEATILVDKFSQPFFLSPSPDWLDSQIPKMES